MPENSGIFKRVYNYFYLKYRHINDNLNRAKYFVQILEITRSTSSNILKIKYHISFRSITREANLHEFINSPLIYAVHPKQLLLLGYEAGVGEIILNKQKSSKSNQLFCRLKRYFYE